MLLLLLGCDPYRAWPDPTTVFPAVYTPETGLEPYAEVRFETETWTVEDDPEELALYLMKSQYHRTGAPAESLAHFEAMRAQIPPEGAGQLLSFAGDIMWMGGNWSAFATPVADQLSGIRVGNLETPTSPLVSHEQGALGIYAFNAPVEMLDALPFDVLQLNNNHTLDAGASGIAATVEQVEAHGYVGTGVDRHHIHEGVAMLSYTWGLNIRDTPYEQELFIVPFGHLDEPVDISGIAADIAAARAAGARSVVALLHWGFEYEYYPDPHFMVLARQIIAAGADLIVGQGPHVVQPPEICHVNNPEVVPGIRTCSVRTDDGAPRTAAVLYSLGNFATNMYTLPCQVGVVARVTLDPDVTGLGWSGVVTVDGAAGPEVQPLETQEGAEVLAEAARLGAHLGEGWQYRR